MSSDEADKKNVEEPSKEEASSADETEEKEEEKPKEEKVKGAAKKKGADPPKIKQPAKKRVKSEQAEKESKKEDKKEDKKKTEENNEDDEDSVEENDVNHKSVPLLDQPLEISGKRKSKEVQRFKPIEPEEESKEVKIPEGKGKALGDIERIDFNIQRAKPEDLKLLHRLCFGKPGKAATVKKVVRKFKGYEFSADSSEFKKKKEFVDKSFKKVTVAHLKNVCNIIDIERSGHKEDLIERILKFLTCPVDSGKKLPGGGRSKRKGASNKNYEEGEESLKSRKKSKAKKKDVESEESESEKEDEDEEEDEEKEEVKESGKKKEDAQTTEESEGEKEEEEEKKPKKGAKRGKKAVDAAEKKAPPKKRAAAKKAAEKKSDSEADADGENESEDDEEPLSKKAKAPPTDEEIKAYVKSLLDGANLEQVTMKKVCQDVYAHYPDFDLTHKKDFIKTTVKNLISS